MANYKDRFRNVGTFIEGFSDQALKLHYSLHEKFNYKTGAIIGGVWGLAATAISGAYSLVTSEKTSLEEIVKFSALMTAGSAFVISCFGVLNQTLWRYVKKAHPYYEKLEKVNSS